MAEPGVKMPARIRADAGAIATTKTKANANARRRRNEERITKMDPPTRAAAAVTMAVEGAPYDDIARVLDYRTPVEAKNAVWDAIAACEADHGDIERMRALHSRRLDKLLWAVYRQASTPGHPDQLSYGRYALAIMAAQAHLYGLDAAQQIMVYTPTQKEIASYAEQFNVVMRAAAGAIEADIIDVEIEVDGASAPRAS